MIASMPENDSRESPSLVLPGFTRVETVSRVWSDIEVRYSEKYPVPGESWADLRSDRTSVIIRLEQRGGCCEPRLKRGESTPRSRCDAGFFNWIPADHPIWCYSDNVRYLRDLQLLFDVNAVASIVEDEHDLSRAREPLLMVYDSKVRGCAHVLADAATEEFRYDRLYGESLTVALVVALLNASRNRTVQQPVGGLTSWQLRVAKEYLEQEVSKNINLAELAPLTGLSRSRLARGFKASTGVAPYTWALQFRIQKAKELLKDRDQPIAATALDVGFADQSHFTKAFRRLAGITPGEWRSQYKHSTEPDAG
ncbi:MAG: AraC family transcriptional regulator [Acidobacteriaceae bacterium]|jgi:AraC family transcriptional regulator|nr:AraC family transcriptional regulator [Acidobacteriaceae bacterium]